MVRSLKIAAVAGCALALSALPVLAQDFPLPGIDLDPFHILTPEAPPAAAAPSPAAGHHHHHHASHAHHHAPKK